MHAFPDKRALLRHARDLLHQQTAERADRAEAKAADPEARLRAVLHQAALLTEDKRDEARVWLAYTAAAVADEDLAQLHRSHNRAFVTRIDRLLAEARPQLDALERQDTAAALVALVEGITAIAALDQSTYRPRRQRRVIDEALARTRS